MMMSQVDFLLITNVLEACKKALSCDEWKKNTVARADSKMDTKEYIKQVLK